MYPQIWFGLQKIMKLSFRHIRDPFVLLLVIVLILSIIFSFLFLLHVDTQGINLSLLDNDSEHYGDWAVMQFVCVPVILIVIGSLIFTLTDRLDEMERVRKGKRKNKKRHQELSQNMKNTNLPNVNVEIPKEEVNDKLSGIEMLGELKDKGFLTEEEFICQAAELKDKGFLTEEEFQAEKLKLWK